MKSLAMELLEVTEAAAMASYGYVGSGDEYKADKAAVEAMRSQLDKVPFSGTIVIGEGERDEAPMLFIGEKVGKGGSNLKVDIAVDPLEGTRLCSEDSDGSMSVLAVSPRGGLLHAPDVYMEKIAIGYPDRLVSLSASITANLENLANKRNCSIKDLKVVVLQRSRHEKLIKEIREAGAKVRLIIDGDIASVLSTILSGVVDMYIGIGGAPEGVLAASALRSLGGYMQGRLILDTPGVIARAKAMGIDNPNKIYELNELVRSDSIFIATGVTNGNLLRGVQKIDDKIILNSLIITKDCVNNITRTINI